MYLPWREILIGLGLGSLAAYGCQVAYLLVYSSMKNRPLVGFLTSVLLWIPLAFAINNVLIPMLTKQFGLEEIPMLVTATGILALWVFRNLRPPRQKRKRQKAPVALFRKPLLRNA